MKSISVLALLAIAAPAFAQAPLPNTPAPPGPSYGSDKAYIFQGPAFQMPAQVEKPYIFDSARRDLKKGYVLPPADGTPAPERKDLQPKPAPEAKKSAA